MEQDLQFYRDFLYKLLEAIRTSPENDVQRIIEVIRSAQSITDVQKEVTHVLEKSSFFRPAR